eukprot:1161024-Pelagomonas_calceolata.AAC.1
MARCESRSLREITWKEVGGYNSVRCMCGDLEAVLRQPIITPMSVLTKPAPHGLLLRALMIMILPATLRALTASLFIKKEVHVKKDKASSFYCIIYHQKSLLSLTPGPKISLRPPSSSTATSVAIFQGPQLKLPSIQALKELSLDLYKATKLALKLHTHSGQHAYKFASTKRALEKTSFSSNQQDQAQDITNDPPDPH